ncbi:MAG: hypothetical protein JWM58_1340 [Rhizobium sp.]|nr:hypothetical protein [Rhizobium sp.]
MGWGDHKTSFIEEGIQVFDSFVANSQLCINDVVDKQRATKACRIELSDRPFGPNGIICHKVEEDVRVDKRRASPRVNAMIASVLSPLPAWPRKCAKQLAFCF